MSLRSKSQALYEAIGTLLRSHASVLDAEIEKTPVHIIVGMLRSPDDLSLNNANQ
jgi:hypothetical protein